MDIISVCSVDLLIILFLRQMCTFSGCLYDLLPGSVQKDERKVVPYISANMQKQFGKKYFGVGKVQGTVDKSGNTTSVTGECQVKVPIRQLFTMHGKEGWRIRTRAKAQIINPTKMIRRCRWAGNMFTD